MCVCEKDRDKVSINVQIFEVMFYDVVYYYCHIFFVLKNEYLSYELNKLFSLFFFCK